MLISVISFLSGISSLKGLKSVKRQSLEFNTSYIVELIAKLLQLYCGYWNLTSPAPKLLKTYLRLFCFKLLSFKE